MLRLDEIIETNNQFKVVPKKNVIRLQSQDIADEQQIKLLKELIKDIEDQRCVQGCVPKSQTAPTQLARYYYRGMTDGFYLAIRVINKRIGRIQVDSN